LSFRNTNGGVKNVVLLQPGYEGTNKTFSDAFLRAITPFSTLRFMDYLATNNSIIQQWAERATPEDFSYARGRGGAWEDLILLANLTGKDIWINIPVLANDDYIVKLATLLKEKLNSRIHIYVENSNEVWNPDFAQGKTNRDLAIAEAVAGD